MQSIPRRLPILFAFSILATRFPVAAQTAVGSLSGRIHTEACSAPASDSGAFWIVLTESTTGYEIQRTRPGADGLFRFREVPFARYRVYARHADANLAADEVSVADALPQSLELSCATELPGRKVSRAREFPLEAAGHLFYSRGEILDMPSVSRAKASEAVLLRNADVVPDEDGRLHVRGEDAQIQYVVDGIPWSGNPTRVYSPLFSADLAKTIDVREGGLPAQYAAGSAVVSVTTRDGLDQPFSARASAGTASFGMREAQLAGLGRLGPDLGLFLSASGSGSDRYLDPVSGFEPNHTGGEGRHLFGKLSFLPTETSELRLVGSFDRSGYQVANREVREPGQDQNAALESWLAGARLDLDPDPAAHFSAAAYGRNTEAHLTSGGLSRLASPENHARALAENESFFLASDRENTYFGGQAEMTLRLGGGAHRLRAGLSGEANPLKESLVFAVTDSALTAAQSDDRLKPYDLTQGGRPLEASGARTGWAASAYVQDAFAYGKWMFQPGLRYDAFSLFEIEQALSPRLAAAYSYSPDLVLRTSLDYLMARAPLENILLSSDPALRPLAGGDQGNTPATVGAERALALDLGADWEPNRFLAFGLTGYGKYLRNFLVKAELGASGLIFPINLKEGFIAGAVFNTRLKEWRRLSGTLSLGTCASFGLKPEDGSSPVAAGLLVGEEGHNYGHPFAGEDIFPTEHNQIATASLSLGYKMGWGLSANLAGRFDSGLPFDLVGADGQGLDEAESRAELKRRGYGDDVLELLSLEPEEPGSPDKSVAPHAVFDLGLSWHPPVRAAGIELRAAVFNVFDTPYLQKFESSFGSTHFGAQRAYGLWASVEY